KENKILRLWKTRLPKHYLDAHGSQKISTNLNGHQNVFGGGSDLLMPDALPLEFMMNVLRLNNGVAKEYFSRRTGLPLSAIESQWRELLRRGLVSNDPARLMTSPLGFRFLNQVLSFFTNQK